MTRFATILALVLMLLVFNGVLAAQTTTLQVTVGPEAALTVVTGTTTLSTTATNFSLPYTGTTSLTYQIRTTKSGGNGSITLKVTSDFAPTGGPSVAGSDHLTYTNTLSAPGTATSGSQTASTTAYTNVGTFGAAANSSAGTGSVAWSLPDDPAYPTGTYSATVTFTISAA